MRVIRLITVVLMFSTITSCFAKEVEESLTEGAYVISSGGEYTISGSYTDSTIVVEAGDEDKVYLKLENLHIENSDSPAIYLKSGDKLSVELIGSNSFTVNSNFKADGETNLDAVIFSRSDIEFSGSGVLDIYSKSGNGIASKDDIKITNGTLNIEAKLDGIEANDSIKIEGGTININTGKDGLHSEYDEDQSRGEIEISGGLLNITVEDDAIYGHSMVDISGGEVNILNSYEGIESTKIYIRGGVISIYSKDDGINATSKNGTDVVLEVSAGVINVEVADGDTDAFDSNGDMLISGGTISVITPRSAFDADGTVSFTGGVVTINGEVVTEIPVSRGGRGFKKGR